MLSLSFSSDVPIPKLSLLALKCLHKNGHALHTSNPLTVAAQNVVVDDGEPLFFCALCGEQESDVVKLNQCVACKTVMFCGVDCQRQDWNAGHKQACKLLKKKRLEGTK